MDGNTAFFGGDRLVDNEADVGAFAKGGEHFFDGAFG